MTDTKEMLQLYEDQAVRTAWDEQEEQWYFSVVDVVSVLTNQPDARHASTYWAVLKKRLAEEGAVELLTNCKQLKLKSADGKRYATDVATTCSCSIRERYCRKMNNRLIFSNLRV